MGTPLGGRRESHPGGIMRLECVPTPAYVIDEGRLLWNCRILAGIMERTGSRILLAQKAFSAYAEYSLIGKYLSGTTASGVYEARLGKEEMGKENHIFSAAYREEDFSEIAELCDHIVFNSIGQLKRFQNRCQGKSIGLRINPQCSTQQGHAIYDPCAPGSRLGVTAEKLSELTEEELSWLDGLHFHTLCEQNADALAVTLDAVEERFGKFLPRMKWINFGGGHHITREDYDVELLEQCIKRIQKKYDMEVYLEPGEAVALNAGYLTASVLDIVENGGVTTLILDTSAACHMPDVLEMPYRPPLRDSGMPGEKAYTYRLAGYSCLAGDVIGDYSFDRELAVGDRLIFEDMAIYSMVKNNTFNGIPLPSIYGMDSDGDCRRIKAFDYSDFKGRLS